MAFMQCLPGTPLTMLLHTCIYDFIDVLESCMEAVNAHTFGGGGLIQQAKIAKGSLEGSNPSAMLTPLISKKSCYPVQKGEGHTTTTISLLNCWGLTINRQDPCHCLDKKRGVIPGRMTWQTRWHHID